MLFIQLKRVVDRMDIENIRKYIGKKVLVILKNDFHYTITIPEFEGTEFTVVDKFDNEVSIDCSYIIFITELKRT